MIATREVNWSFYFYIYQILSAFTFGVWSNPEQWYALGWYLMSKMRSENILTLGLWNWVYAVFADDVKWPGHDPPKIDNWGWYIVGFTTSGAQPFFFSSHVSGKLLALIHHDFSFCNVMASDPPLLIHGLRVNVVPHHVGRKEVSGSTTRGHEEFLILRFIRRRIHIF